MRQTHELNAKSNAIISIIFLCCHTLFFLMFSAVKDEDSDMEVPDDEGSDSDIEESRPSKPRPARNGIMTGTNGQVRQMKCLCQN